MILNRITVGYGDFVPINSYERLLTILITLISSALFAYSVNTIGTIITNI